MLHSFDHHKQQQQQQSGVASQSISLVSGQLDDNQSSIILPFLLTLCMHTVFFIRPKDYQEYLTCFSDAVFFLFFRLSLSSS